LKIINPTYAAFPLENSLTADFRMNDITSESGEQKPDLQERRDNTEKRPWRPRLVRLSIIILGLVLPQLIIYWPSLFGGKLLLPLDLTAVFYEIEGVDAQNAALYDRVTSFEPMRRFSAEELRAGRSALWNPNNFAGAPFTFAVFSPFHMVYMVWPTPHSLGWIQVLKTVFAGLGAYLFLRRGVGVGFWPATIAAWSLPLTGFYTVWQGYYCSDTAAFLPWILLTTYLAIVQPRGKGVIGLACLTALALICGQIDIALQVLLISGFYAIWLLVTAAKVTKMRSLLTVTLGWIGGFMLAAPVLLPMLEYISTGMRMMERAAGLEARPPTGISAFPQLLIPDFYGITQADWAYFGALNLPESAASGCTGLLVTLLLAPLAFYDRLRRRETLFWLGIVIFTLSWTLNIPGFVSLLRLPVMNLMSHNRFVFVSSFALLVMAAMGLEALRTISHSTIESVKLRAAKYWWFLIPATILLAMLIWCIWRWQHPIPATASMQSLSKIKHSEDLLDNLQGVYLKGAIFCFMGLLGWFYVFTGARSNRRGVTAVLVIAMFVEYFSFAASFNPQADPALYYPDRPMFSFLRGQSGRALAVKDWPPSLLSMHGLKDIRGYDGIDPARLIQVLRLAENISLSMSPNWARTQYYVPLMEFTSDGQIRLRAPLNMLNVRWLIFRGTIPSQARPVIRDGACWVVENVAALPRVFVPQQVEPSPGEQTALPMLKAEGFDPAVIAYVDGKERITGVKGSAKVISEVSDSVTLRAEMETPGMVVLADQWYPGWRVWVNEKEAKVHRINHVLRGVSVPAGSSTIVYRYEPVSFRIGFWLMCCAIVMLSIWAVFLRQKSAPIRTHSLRTDTVT